MSGERQKGAVGQGRGGGPGREGERSGKQTVPYPPLAFPRAEGPRRRLCLKEKREPCSHIHHLCTSKVRSDRQGVQAESGEQHGDPQTGSGTPVLHKHPPSPPCELSRPDTFGMRGLETSPTPPHPSFHCLQALLKEQRKRSNKTTPVLLA